MLATLLNMLQQGAVAQMSQPSSPSIKFLAALQAAVIYPFFLYANFSGYIDIVIALARLMRLRLPENFDQPFSAASVLDFWNPWHITLSRWLKTCVYNPLILALMRRISSPSAQPFFGVPALFVTFLQVGLWHPRTSEFLVFGIVTGGEISVNKLWQVETAGKLGRQRYKALAKNPAYIAFARGLTISWFAFTLFWFWGSWKEIDMINGQLGAVEWLGVWLSIWVLVTAVLTLWEWLRAALLSIQSPSGPALTSRYARVVYASALGMDAFVMTGLLNQRAPDVAYKAF